MGKAKNQLKVSLLQKMLENGRTILEHFGSFVSEHKPRSWMMQDPVNKVDEDTL